MVLLLAGCSGNAATPSASAPAYAAARAAARNALVSVSSRAKGTATSVVTYAASTGHVVRTIDRSAGGQVAYGHDGFLYAQFGTAASPSVAAFPPKHTMPRWTAQSGVSAPGTIVASRLANWIDTT